MLNLPSHRKPNRVALGFWIQILLLLPTMLSASNSEHPSSDTFPSALLELPSETHTHYLKNTDFLNHVGEVPLNSTVVCAIDLHRGKKTASYCIEMGLDSNAENKSTNSMGTLYTSTGRTFVFESKQVTLFTKLSGNIRIKKDGKIPIKAFEMNVNGDYLGLGLHRLHEFFEATQRYRHHVPEAQQMSYTIRSTPFEDSTQLFPPEVLEISELSEASERAFVGALPALTEFFKIIYETDGLKDILMELIPKKKLLRLLNPFSNTGLGFSYGTPTPYKVDASPLQLGLAKVGVIPVNLSIGAEPILQLQLYTTEPSYEWKSSAGIVALSIISVADPERSCFIRVFPKAMIMGRLEE